ncbi:DUF4124 domain-containing protein [Salinisphaera sp.]|uniref:DUF4124 domain-containing protein n=1 Tax=Salinisphaera sp. TaxID=1914330 RepID=UPI002D7920D5|nr:DUF4124 domain-containing protein [Salinisphaera sp.]HET7313311.1 DUF4124 domain-containing protein [Salinisphaera sp.]
MDRTGLRRYSGFLAVAGLALAAPVQATVYTWTDAQGVRHYSDTSRAPGARVANVKTGPTPANAPGAPSDASVANGAPAGDARALNIISPQPGQMFTNDQGQIPVSIIVGSGGTAQLGDGEALRYRLDGAPIGDGPTQATRLTLSNVAAGTHTFSATLLYRGHAVQRSDPVSFRVERGHASTPAKSLTHADRPPS